MYIIDLFFFNKFIRIIFDNNILFTSKDDIEHIITVDKYWRKK